MELKAPLAQKDILISTLKTYYGVSDDQFNLTDGSEYAVADVKVPVNKDTMVSVEFTKGDMEAYLTVYPPAGNGVVYSFDDFLSKIKELGVIYNINMSEIDKVYSLCGQGVISSNVLIATGSAMFPGKDAIVMFQFSPTDKRPKISSDGNVDYKNVDNIVQVRKGDVLILKRPSTLGIKGVTVKNVETMPEPGKDIDIICGSGVGTNSLGTEYVAVKSGSVDFSGNVISVHEIYYVDKNVDFSTGNIKFNGTVHIKGDVSPGFTVEADGDIIVDGICSDCELHAGNNIYIKTGIKCTGNNSFKAERTIKVGYCEKAKLFAKECITIEKYAYNCDLYSGGTINAVSSDGIIAGGIVRAFDEVKAKQLGTQGNSNFCVYLGTKYYVDMALEKLRRQRAEAVDLLGRMAELLSNFTISNTEVASNQKISKLTELQSELKQNVSGMDTEEAELMKHSGASDPRVKVYGRVYEGVCIMLFNCSTTVKDAQENVVYYYNKKQSEIAWVSLKDAENSVLN